MKLLITTQTVNINDPVLGFFHRWLKEFAENCEQVTVICLQVGEYQLPPNVKVISLGKEKLLNCYIVILLYCWNFYKYIWQERKNYDAVFVHMNPEYIVLGGLFWRLWRKKITLWYTHKSVNLKLRIAAKLADKIFTASAKSFRLASKKVNIMGHGIDLEKFRPVENRTKQNIILQVGRIAPAKRQLELIKIFAEINQKNSDTKLYLVGQAVQTKDKEYEQEVKNYIQKNNLTEKIKMYGAVANKDMPAIYQQADVLVNLSATGSLDKDVLEAMACNVHPVTINEAFEDILPADNIISDLSLVKDKILYFLQLSQSNKYRLIIEKNHNLKKLIINIVDAIKI